MLPEVEPDVLDPEVEPEVVPVVVLPDVEPDVLPYVVLPLVAPEVLPAVVEPEVLPEVEPLVEPAFSEAEQELNKVSDKQSKTPVSMGSHLGFVFIEARKNK